MASYESVFGDPTAGDYAKNNIVSIVTPGGVKLNVHRQAAEAFKGFLAELEGTGYKINSAGGYNLRNITGGSTLSPHAFGTAVDINPTANLYDKSGKLTTDLPSNVGDLAQKYGLTWGGNWKSPTDAMHFEYGWTPQSFSALSMPGTAPTVASTAPTTPAATQTAGTAPNETAQVTPFYPMQGGVNGLSPEERQQRDALNQLQTVSALMGMFKGTGNQSQANPNAGLLQALALAAQTGRGNNRLLTDTV